MKEVLGIGILILCAVLALRFGGMRGPANGEGGGPESSVSIQIYSTAWGHLPDLYVARRNPVAIIVNGAFASGAIEEAGLRVVAIRAGAIGSMRNFSLADSVDDIDRFEAYCASAEAGTAFAMGVHRVASPPIEDESASRVRLARVFASLGARQPPTSSPASSWAFICVKTDDGWHSIAEVTSSSKGVHLSRVLNTRTLSTRLGGGSLLVDEWSALSFIDRFPQASEVTGGAQYTRVERSFNGVAGASLAAIFAHPPYGDLHVTLGYEENRLAWDDLTIPTNGIFRTQLGIASWALPESDGVQFQLLIDGELIASKDVGTRPFSPDSWVPWSVDLSRYSGQSVRFEMRVAPNGNTNSDHALWGNPVIEYRAN